MKVFLGTRIAGGYGVLDGRSHVIAFKRQRNARTTSSKHPHKLFSVFGPIKEVSAFYTHERPEMAADSNSMRPSLDPQAQPDSAATGHRPTRVFEERHYTVAEIATLWKLSTDVVRKLFRNEPGVLAIGVRNPRGKRAYLTLRIPQSVVERVHRQIALCY